MSPAETLRQHRLLATAIGLAGARRGLAAALTALLSVAVATAAIYPLETVAPVVSLSVVYLPAVLLASARWGLAAGLGASLLSAAAFNFFHIPPVGRFTIADSRNWVALGAFTIVAVVASAMAERARSRAHEAEMRRAEADLAALLARELLAGPATAEQLPIAARRLAEALGLRSATITLGASAEGERRQALELQDSDGARLGTLLVPRPLPVELHARLLTRVVPTLAALLEVALRRDALQDEAVETAALRRSDEVKTALLRAVSHDLRTPLTAIVASGHALGSRSLSADERAELAAAVVQEAERLAGLVEKLLDLSRLHAGGIASQREWIAPEEVLVSARESLHSSAPIRLLLDPGVPEVRADAAQLERAVANLLENAVRHGGGEEVCAHARRSGTRVLLSVVDRGPGIAPAEQERIFEPFYRGRGGEHSAGSGLGLAIARGLVEANGGTLAVSSLPGQGTSFTISLPLEPQDALAALR